MKYRLLFFTIGILECFLTQAQDLLIYQPKKDGKIKIYNSSKQLFSYKFLRLNQGEKFKIRILNPNPLFYKYEISYEAQKEESEDKDITDALILLNTGLSSRFQTSRDEVNPTPEQTFEQYKNSINQLMDDIKLAQSIINQSDVPELESDALIENRNSGLKYAIDQITGKVTPGTTLVLSDDKYRFRSSSLLTDLNDLMSRINSIDPILKQALTLLNNSVVQKINEIKKSVDEVESELESEFVVTDKTTKVFLGIQPLDPKKTDLIRKYNTGNEKTEIATIIPNYKRATIELVPVGNFLFAHNIKEFYLDNNIIQSRYKNKTTFTPGVILNFNLASFGTSKEMAAGVGAGYKFSDDSKELQNFYFSTLFSYKNFFRVGLGIGFAQFPYSLNNDGKIGQPLPANITNLDDLLEYQEKPAGFLSISFTGLSLSKKK